MREYIKAKFGGTCWTAINALGAEAPKVLKLAKARADAGLVTL